MKFKTRSQCLLLTACYLLGACSPSLETPSHLPTRLPVLTSGSLHSLVAELTDMYRRTHPWITFEVRDGNAVAAFDELARASSAVALVTRSPRAEELERAEAQVTVLGRDGIAIIVNPSNSVTNLTREQAGKIFAGEIHDWRDKQLNAKLPIGASPVIAVVSRESGSGTRQVFEATLMVGRRVTLTAILQPSERDVLEYVAAQPDAIGYLSFHNSSARVRALLIDGVAPTLDNVANGKYVLVRPVYLAYSTRPTPDQEEFIAFLRSNNARQVIEKYLAVR